ncbi:uncharacterized protein LOC127086335 [Lathyrus oleraceus]|uniref:uncharacterized protein LOC127086334 n=1 Tax=Pisum sativum TaxID=3888 RepID=UPI0021D39760|nr:uncharacterized protein LOC127086334 [Pisum sativum]XP_050883049.1 uncharacterized protein LOC127086335 [Pisum sativum]
MIPRHRPQPREPPQAQRKSLPLNVAACVSLNFTHTQNPLIASQQSLYQQTHENDKRKKGRILTKCHGGDERREEVGLPIQGLDELKRVWNWKCFLFVLLCCLSHFGVCSEKSELKEHWFDFSIQLWISALNCIGICFDSLSELFAF